MPFNAYVTRDHHRVLSFDLQLRGISTKGSRVKRPRAYLIGYDPGSSIPRYFVKSVPNPTLNSLKRCQYNHKTDHRDQDERHIREWRTYQAAQPFFPPVIDYGMLHLVTPPLPWLDAPRHCLVSAFIPGTTLADWLVTNQQDAPRCQAGIQRVKALIRTLHDALVCHGSVSVYNIMMDENETPHLTDWNMAHGRGLELCKRFRCFEAHDRYAEDWDALRQSLYELDQEDGTDWTQSV